MRSANRSEEKCVSSEDYKRRLRIKELPAVHSNLDPQCLRKNLKPIVFLIGTPAFGDERMQKFIPWQAPANGDIGNTQCICALLLPIHRSVGALRDAECVKKIGLVILNFYVVLGGPNSASKGLGKMIEYKYDLSLIPVGELIEKEIKAGTRVGKFVEPTVRGGGLVEPEIAVWLLKREMLNLYRCSKGYIIEGFPRTQEQLVLFENEVARAHIMFYLKVDNARLEQMLLSPQVMGSKTDNLLSRICIYQEHTVPLKDDCGTRCKIIYGDGQTAWKMLDQALGKMMWEWAFLKKDVAGMENLCSGEKVRINYSSFLAPDVRGVQNKEFGAHMFEIVGGIVPYFVQWNCTRQPLGRPEFGLH